ncbi:MAG: 50S ribosomal protein L25/general stress protein Ctc [Alphaproteobacteria bacterium]|nr:50S ribosomal protein L25/general stress protein Ctc [Alphaproteobacteria bacterium]
MSNSNIAVKMRDRVGKGGARSTRRMGSVPAVIYGNKEKPIFISMDPIQLNRVLHKAGFFATLLNLSVEGKTIRVLPKDVQFDPVTDVPIHADFLRVSTDTQLRVKVPVKFVNDNQAPGLKRGGVLNIVLHEVELLCHVDNIPAHITVDLKGLDIGDSVHISQIALPDKVVPALRSQDFTIASLAPPNAQRETAGPAAGAEGATATTAAAATSATPAAATAAKGATPAKPTAGAAKADKK